MHSAVTAEGWVLLDETGASFSGVSIWNVRTNEHRDVLRFPAGSRDVQVQGGLEGGYAIVKVMLDLMKPDFFTLYGYDIEAAKVWRIAQNTVDAKGEPMPSSWDPPVVQGGYAAYILATGPDGERTLFVDNLKTHEHTSALTEKSLVGVDASGDDLVVTHADRHRTLLDPATRKSVPSPELSRLDGNFYLDVGPGGAAVFVGGGDKYNEVWYTPNLRTHPPYLLATLPDSVLQDSPEIGPASVLLFLNGYGTYWIDAVSGRATRLTRVLGGFAGSGTDVLVPAEVEGVKTSATSGTLWHLPAGALSGDCTPSLKAQ